MRFFNRVHLTASAMLLAAVITLLGAGPACAGDQTEILGSSALSLSRGGEVSLTAAWRFNCSTYISAKYKPEQVDGSDKNLKLLLLLANKWEDITCSLDRPNTTITGRTISSVAKTLAEPTTVSAEDTDPRIAYTDGWSTSVSPDFSGGSLAYGSTGCLARIAFTGTGADLVALTGPTYGIARVTLDGGETTLVDLYAPQYEYRQMVYSRRRLTQGPHTIVIEHTGTKNAASVATRVNLDAVGIVGELTQAPLYARRFEQDDSRIAYRGYWTKATGPDFSAGSLSYGAKDCEAAISFSGTGIDLVALTGPSYGVARVTIDSAEPVMVDLYSPAWEYKKVVFSRRDLADTSHTLRVAYTGTKNSASTAANIDIDAFDIVGRLLQADPYPIRLESTDPAVRYSGAWTTAASPDFSGGSLVYGSSGCTATVSFNGAGFDLICLTGPTYGYARLLIDGEASLVNLYSPVYAYRQVVFSARDLALGPHQVVIEHANAKDTGSQSTRINIDAIDVLGTVPAQ